MHAKRSQIHCQDTIVPVWWIRNHQNNLRSKHWSVWVFKLLKSDTKWKKNYEKQTSTNTADATETTVDATETATPDMGLFSRSRCCSRTWTSQGENAEVFWGWRMLCYWRIFFSTQVKTLVLCTKAAVQCRLSRLLKSFLGTSLHHQELTP